MFPKLLLHFFFCQEAFAALVCCILENVHDMVNVAFQKLLVNYSMGNFEYCKLLYIFPRSICLLLRSNGSNIV